jgi:hypothetical protein
MGTIMQRFVMIRISEEDGVETEHIVAEGVKFSDGSCVVKHLDQDGLNILKDADAFLQFAHDNLAVHIIMLDEDDDDIEYEDKNSEDEMGPLTKQELYSSIEHLKGGELSNKLIEDMRRILTQTLHDLCIKYLDNVCEELNVEISSDEENKNSLHIKAWVCPGCADELEKCLSRQQLTN